MRTFSAVYVSIFYNVCGTKQRPPATT